MKVMNSAKKTLQRGFSLVEMLVVIAIIGVIAAIAVPTISNFTDNANEGKDKRNAQNLASVCSAAQAAGLDFVGASTDKAAIVALIVAGDTVDDGAFAGEFFGVPGMGAAEQTDAVAHLTAAGGVLRYTPVP